MRDWFLDRIDGDFGFLWFTGAFVLVCGVLVSLLVGGMMALDRAGCAQRNEARPSVPMEWHWAAGCIAVDPSETVVISS